MERQRENEEPQLPVLGRSQLVKVLTLELGNVTYWERVALLVAEVRSSWSSMQMRRVVKWINTRQGRKIIQAKLSGWVRRAFSRVRYGSTFIPEPPVDWTFGPLVSVVVPVHNQKSELVALRMCLEAQTLTEIEVIVWDDGSTDETTVGLLEHWQREGVERKGDDTALQVRFFRHHNQGVVATRNAAIEKALGHYLCFIDPDDRIEATYLEKALLRLEGDPFCQVAVPTVRLDGHPTEQLWEPENLSWPEIVAYNQLPISSLVLRSTVQDAGNFRPEFDQGWEDWDLWVRVAAAGARSARLPEPLFHYTHSDSQGRDALVSRPNAEALRERIHTLAPKSPAKPVAGGVRTSVSKLLDAMTPRLLGGRPGLVLFLIPWLIRGGGADGFIRRLGEGLIERGLNVAFVCTELEIPANAIDARADLFEITPYVYNLGDFLSPADFSPYITRLLSMADLPLVFCVGSRAYYEYLKDGEVERPNHIAVDILFNDVGHVARHREVRDEFDSVVAVHSRLAASLHAVEVASAPIRTIPVGIDSSGSSERREPSHLSVGWLGRFSREKRPEWAIEIAASCEGLAKFEMVGTGPLIQECRHAGRHIKGLEVHGYMEDLAPFWDSIQLLVLTSSVEGIAVTALEAIQRGIPVVSTDVGGMRDLIKDGVNGYLLPPDSVSPMISQVRELVENRDQLIALMRQTREMGLPAAFQSSVMVDSYMELIGELMSGPKGGADAA